MPSVDLIVIIALVLVGVVAALLSRASRNAAAILMVAGIAGAAIVVTAIAVGQYRTDQAAARSEAAEAAPVQAHAPLPPPNPNTVPVLQGATGAAAPAPVRPPRS